MQYLALDIGNVICKLNFKGFSDMLLRLGHIKEPSEGILFLEGVQAPLDIGLYGVEEAVLKYFPSFSRNNLKDLHEAWLGTIEPCNLIGEFIESLLTDHNFEIALLSNIGSDHSRYLRKRMFVYNRCIQHFSYEVGARKPAKLFFQSFLLDHSRFKDCLFLDDKIENIEMAKRCGLNGKVFSLENFNNSEDAVESLKNIILAHEQIGL